jgi:tetraacyldisaccharide 4'-kinase
MRRRLDPWLQRLWADRPDPPAGGGLYLLRGLLIPAAMLYASFAWTRRELYRNGFLRSRHLHGTVVVSIGNLTVGGTGKSPLAIGLARGLMDADLRVAVISRGYGGSGRGSGPLLVSDGSGPLVGPDLAGDEPVMIARATSAVVIVSRHRYLGARLARDHYGAQLIILDDGFQHLGLARQADLVLLDVNEPFGNRWALPAGPLREPLSALADADLCLFVQRDNDQAAPLPERLHRLMQVVACGCSTCGVVMTSIGAPPRDSKATRCCW